jgi:hypothetical protein
VGPGDFTHTPIDDATRGAVARFSDTGSYLYYPDSNSSGLLRPYSSDALLSGYALEEFSAECPLTFTSDSRFFYQQCASRGRGFAEGVIEDTGLTTTVHNDTLRDSLALGPAGRCFANWGDGELDIGPTSLPLQVEFTRTAGTDISFAALSPRDDAVVWVEGGDEVYWLPLNADCTVSTIPKVVTSGSAVQTLHFVGEFP